MSELLYVTNKTDKKIETKYNFETYTFPVNNTVAVSPEAARHIFGYGIEEKEPYLARLGWIRMHSELEEGLEKLSKVDILTASEQENRSLPSAVGVVPLHVERRAGGKSIARA